MTSIESLAWWKIHVAAQRKAEAAGACWRCAAEMGCALMKLSNRSRVLRTSALCRADPFIRLPSLQDDVFTTYATIVSIGQLSDDVNFPVLRLARSRTVFAVEWRGRRKFD